MRQKILLAVVCLGILAVTAVLTGCLPGESPTPTIPADTPQPARPPWQQIYTGISFYGPSLGLISGWHGTILRSVDTGQNWTETKVPTAGDLNSIAILNASTAIAVGSGGNILRSTDSGQTWIKIESPTMETLNAVAAVSDGSAVAVGWHGTIIGTTDGGKTWTSRFNSQEPSLNFEAVDLTKDGTGMAVSSSGRIFKTTDTYNWLPQVLPDAGQKLFAVDLFDDNNAFTAGNIEEEKAYQVGGKTVILKTETGGQVWGYGPRNLNADPLAVRYVDRLNAVIVGWEGLILITGDGGGSWSPIVSPTSQALRAIAMADATTIVAVGNGQTIISSRNGGDTWNKIRGS